MQHVLDKPHQAPLLAGKEPRHEHLYEVWGDTIESRDLLLAILIGGAVSLGTFGVAHFTLHNLVESAQMAKAYSMLVGILGCLAGGVISARLFKPKRDVIEQAADPAFREQVVADLLNEYGTLGRLQDLSPAMAAELHQLELYELFHDAQEREAQVLEESARAALEAEQYMAANAALTGGRV
ncbi:TPA: hypothetical protein ACLEX3_003710 [Pseudomonas aeruginosa]